MKYLLLFHVSSRYADMLQCYVICAFSNLHFIALKQYVLKHNTTRSDYLFQNEGISFYTKSGTILKHIGRIYGWRQRHEIFISGY